MEVAIIGIGAASVSFTEYTSLNVLKRYTELIIPLKNIFTASPASLTSLNYDTILTQIEDLKTLARQGETDSNGYEEFQSFMNEEMAVSLNDIMRTLSIVGIPPGANTPPLTSQDKINTILAWQSLPNFQIDVLAALNQALAIIQKNYQYTVQVTNPGTGIVTDLSVEASPTRTLQSMLELEYVGAGNAQMAGKLGDLEEGLTLSQKILVTLKGIQDIANQIQVTNRIDPSGELGRFNLRAIANGAGGNIEEFKADYKRIASAYFSQIFPSAMPVATAASQLLELKQTLWNEMLELEKVNPSATRSTSNSLANSLFNVVKDISTAFANISTANNPNLQSELFDAVKQWILDNQDKVSSALNNQAGDIQDRLTFAVKSAENLEEKQREDVRRHLFLFQEFYKSAGSMIELLVKIFEKINRGIKQ